MKKKRRGGGEKETKKWQWKGRERKGGGEERNLSAFVSLEERKRKAATGFGKGRRGSGVGKRWFYSGAPSLYLFFGCRFVFLLSLLPSSSTATFQQPTSSMIVLLLLLLRLFLQSSGGCVGAGNKSVTQILPLCGGSVATSEVGSYSC